MAVGKRRLNRMREQTQRNYRRDLDAHANRYHWVCDVRREHTQPYVPGDKHPWCCALPMMLEHKREGVQE